MTDEKIYRDAVSLREYLDREIHNLSLRLAEQQRYTDKAVDKAEFALSKRLDGMNEFRDALRDQASRMATREQLDQLRERIIEMEKRAAVTSALVGMSVSVIVSVIVALLSKWLIK